MSDDSTHADLSCDVAIIGAGTAGLAAKRAARNAGARTLLIDPEFAGTTCATVGCMPSKLLIAASHAAHNVRRAREFGVRAGELSIDGAAVMQRVQAERDRFVAATRKGIEDIPENTRVTGRARFLAQDRLALDDGRVVSARAIVIATGSTPMVPGPFKQLGDRVLTSDTVFDLPDLPESMAVVGAGPIGLELAQAFGRLGVRVALFDGADKVGKVRSTRVHEILRTSIERDLDLHLGVEPQPTKVDDGVRLDWSEKGTDRLATFDYVLVAAGRPPTLDGLELKSSGLALDERGTPHFDRTTMQCGRSSVFIAGDANTDAPLLHEASTEGAIAGKNAALFPGGEARERPVPFALTFCDPNVASIGAAPDDDTICGIADFADQGRAKVEARNLGVVELYADRTGRLTGAELCAPDGEHLAHLLAWAVMSGTTASQLLSMPLYHPTLEEGLKPALRAICRASNISEPEGRDLGYPPAP